MEGTGENAVDFLKLKKQKKKTLVQQGYHVYMGTVKSTQADRKPTIVLPEPGVSLVPPAGYLKGIVCHSLEIGGCGIYTSVAVHPTQFGKPFAYTCAGCKKRIFNEQILGKEPDPLSFHAFGDESTAKGVVTYGLVIVNDVNLVAAASNFREILDNASGEHGARFHCREAFAVDARSKSLWHQKSEEDMWQIAKDLILSLKQHRAMFCVGVVKNDTFPENMPSGCDTQIALKSEHLYPLAFNAAMRCVDDHRLIEPNVAFQLLVDPQKSKVEFWGMGGAQVGRLLQYKHIVPRIVDQDKPLLIDAADIFSYVSARTLSPEPSRNKNRCQEIYDLSSPVRGDGWWQPN